VLGGFTYEEAGTVISAAPRRSCGVMNIRWLQKVYDMASWYCYDWRL